MAFVRTKNVHGHKYYQLVESYREDGKVKQRVLAHLGPYATLDEALECLPRSIEFRRKPLTAFPQSVQRANDRGVARDERRLATLKRLREEGIA